MSRIRGKNTALELIVRRIVHRLGFRFRLHQSGLPGKPDLVFRRLRKIIMVNGCFWHRHNCRLGRVSPKTNVPYWADKWVRNRERDRKVRSELRRLGWEVFVVWQCQCKSPDRITNMLADFLGNTEDR